MMVMRVAIGGDAHILCRIVACQFTGIGNKKGDVSKTHRLHINLFEAGVIWPG